jgi:hypothetical protein
MFPLPTTPPPPPKRPRTTTGLAPEDRGRLILLGVGLLFCLAVAAGLYSYIRATSAPPPTAPPPGAGPGTGEGPILDISPAPLFPEDEAEEIQKILLERMTTLAAVTDGVAAVDPEPYEFLVDQATLNARVMNLLPEGFDRRPDVARILADPGSHRARLFRVSGELLSLQRLPYEGKGRQVLEVRRGVLRDGMGRLFSFTWPVGNSLEPDAVEPGKGWVRVRGLFYKVWPVADPAAPGKEVPSLHLVLQRAPERDYPAVQVTDIDPAWMEEVHDGEPSEMLHFYDPPFYLILNMVAAQGPEGFEAWLKAKQEAAKGLRIWPPEDFTGRYKDFFARPEAYRFRPVRYTGFLVRPTIETPPPNPGGLDRIYVGFLVDMDFAPAVWVFSPRSLVDQGFKVNDRIRVDGLFFKRVAYEPRGGGPLNQAAILIAGKVVAAPLERTVDKTLLALAVAFSVLVAGGLAFSLLRTRKEDRLAEERRKERLAKKRKGPEA